MIDSHCHLEQKDYDKDLPQLITKWKAAGLKAVVSSSTAISDFDKALAIRARWPDFVFLAAALHPEYIKEVTEEQVEALIGNIRQHADKLVGIGETGLDRFWVKEPEWQKEQESMFVRFIELARELNKPLMVHTREAHEDVVRILEEQNAKRVHLHLWGSHGLLNRVIDNGWLVSIGPLIATSKSYKKIARDMPLEQIMLETDSPWFGGQSAEGKRMRGEPTNIRLVAEKIAQEKKLPFDEVWAQCARNAIRFYGLPLRF